MQPLCKQQQRRAIAKITKERNEISHGGAQARVAHAGGIGPLRREAERLAYAFESMSKSVRAAGAML